MDLQDIKNGLEVYVVFYPKNYSANQFELL
jgi:hypothetical protein